MTVTVFTHREQSLMLERMLSAISSQEYPLDFKIYDCYDDFIASFAYSGSSEGQAIAVIVARKGAEGMESARNARMMQPSVPLVWLSDDDGFGIESYRIGCAFFSAKEISENLLLTALKRCERERRS